MTRSTGLLAVALLLASCDGDGRGEPDAPGVSGVEDARPPPPPPLPLPAGTVSAGAGRVRGGPWTVDFQIGTAIVQRPAQGSGWTAASAAPHARQGGAR